MILFSAAYLISVVLAWQDMNVLAGLVLICAAVFLYVQEYRRTGVLLNLRGLLALGLIGGEGISCFKLSRLQGAWSARTWVCFYLFYLVFWLVYGAAELWFGRADRLETPEGEWVSALQSDDTAKHSQTVRMPCEREVVSGRAQAAVKTTSAAFLCNGNRAMETAAFRRSILALLILSWGAFFLEAAVLGYVPLLVKNTPHAYSYFHLSGIHYFTTLAVLCPSVSLLYRLRCGRTDVWVWAGILLPLALTVLLVSRFQFLFAVILALFTALLSGVRPKIPFLAGLFAGMLVVYVVITIARAHSVEYLNGIFEMKNPDMPIFITQPYMYIANNYDNFDCMVRQLQHHSFGLKMLFPVFALTGVKFLIPTVLSFPAFTTKAELTTLTLIYDSWYDFGLFGVLLFAVLLAALCAWAAHKGQKSGNPFSRLALAQLAFYLLFSFFTTWFSNPSTWFYLAATLLLALYWRFRVKHCASGG